MQAWRHCESRLAQSSHLQPTGGSVEQADGRQAKFRVPVAEASSGESGLVEVRQAGERRLDSCPSIPFSIDRDRPTSATQGSARTRGGLADLASNDVYGCGPPGPTLLVTDARSPGLTV